MNGPDAGTGRRKIKRRLFLHTVPQNSNISPLISNYIFKKPGGMLIALRYINKILWKSGY